MESIKLGNFPFWMNTSTNPTSSVLQLYASGQHTWNYYLDMDMDFPCKLLKGQKKKQKKKASTT